jgi:hypothetical protein
MANKLKAPVLTGKEIAKIGAEGVLMAIPFVGPSLAHFVSAPLTELRQKRVEATLKEVAERLGKKKAKSIVNENLSIFSKRLPPI